MKRHAIGPEAIPFGMGIVGIDLASKFATDSPPSAHAYAVRGGPVANSWRVWILAWQKRPSDIGSFMGPCRHVELDKE